MKIPFMVKNRMAWTGLPALLVSFALAATPPSLVGTVIDPAGHPVAKATVKLKHHGASTLTDDAGRFRFSDLGFPAAPGIRAEALFQINKQALAFNVLASLAPVRLTVHDFSGREVLRPLDTTLARGLYSIYPLASHRFRLAAGIYDIRLHIGDQTYEHRIPMNRDNKFRQGLKFNALSLGELAKISGAGLDTLVITRSGHLEKRMEILVYQDSLADIVLYPDRKGPWQTDDPAYLKAVAQDVKITPLLTTGEDVPYTGDSSRSFLMGGIPDGLGLAALDAKSARLFMNHEIASSDSVHAVTPGPAIKGAYVSEYLLEKPSGRILSGKPAFTEVQLAANGFKMQGTFERLCSGFLGGPAEGLTTPLYLTGEESSEDGRTFTRQGPQAVAIGGGVAFMLPDFGKIAFENIVVVPTRKPARTVAFALEDGPSQGSPLYMYVGEKVQDDRVPHVLRQNGLVGGKLYVFSAAGGQDEGTFASGARKGRWADPLLGRQLPARGILDIARDTLDRWSRVSVDRKDSSFNFDRIEDGTYDRESQGVFYFVTTGDPSSARNRYGRIYKLTFDPVDPVTGKPPVLEILAQGDSASGFVSPDNIDIGPGGKMVICEDFNLALPRSPAVWMLDLKSKGLRKLAEVDVSAVPAESRPAGLKTLWETSGVIDASSQLGAGSWLINVQPHSVGGAAAASLQGLPADKSLVQGGQLLLLRATP